MTRSAYQLLASLQELLQYRYAMPPKGRTPHYFESKKTRVRHSKSVSARSRKHSSERSPLPPSNEQNAPLAHPRPISEADVAFADSLAAVAPAFQALRAFKSHRLKRREEFPNYSAESWRELRKVLTTQVCWFFEWEVCISAHVRAYYADTLLKSSMIITAARPSFTT